VISHLSGQYEYNTKEDDEHGLARGMISEARNGQLLALSRRLGPPRRPPESASAEGSAILCGDAVFYLVRTGEVYPENS